MVVTEEEAKLQQAQFEVTWTDEETGAAKKAKKVCIYSSTSACVSMALLSDRRPIWIQRRLPTVFGAS